jgi:hypothetical protein
MSPAGPRPKKPTRRHHFTPVLYLRKFTDAAGALHVVNRQSGGRFETSSNGIGFERNLYWPDNLQEGDDPELYENQFRDFEGKAAPVIHEIVERRVMPTDEDKLQLLFNFIAFQYVRTPSARRLVAAPREHTARIIIDLLENSKELYESHMRQAGCSLEEHPWEKFRQGKGKYVPRLTTEGFIEGAMMMMKAILKWLHQRTWTVVSSDRPRESFVVSDHPVVLEWSDGKARRLPPGHAHLNTELSFPLGSHVALLGTWEPFEPDPASVPVYVSGINSRTISRCRVFVAACEEGFILQQDGEIITSDQFIEQLKEDSKKT